MIDPSDRLRVRLGAIFAAREARLREARGRDEQEALRREAFVASFRERAQDCLRPAFEVAADVVEAHGFEGRVKLEFEPEEGRPSVRFELHPGATQDHDPMLGRAALRYEADVEAQRVVALSSVGGGDYAAFARSFETSEEFAVDALVPETVERHLAVLVARAVDDGRGHAAAADPRGASS